MKRALLACTALALTISMAACTSEREATKLKVQNDTQYWQRVNTTSSIYLRGAKAQQMLARDVARCTVEINELSRQGLIREAIPTHTVNGQVQDPDSARGKLAHWETPERDGHLLHEVIEYHDFETCMQHKGWARVEYLPYEQAVKARDEYLVSIGKEAYQSKHVVEKEPIVEDSFDHLNDDVE